MKYWLLGLFLTVFGTSFSQTEETDYTYEVVKGTKYILHVAQSGNTLWGLHTTYNVSVDEIVKTNPGIEKGLKEGYQYLIPVGKSEVSVPDHSKLQYHLVAKGETAYGICKKYVITPETLEKYNPATKAGLKVGQKLLIVMPLSTNEVPVVIPDKVNQDKPTPTVTFSDTLLNYTVKEGETFYSISKRFMVPVTDLQQVNGLKSTKIKPGDVLKIPLKKETVKQIPIREIVPVKPERKVDQDLIFKPKSNYQIAVLLTFDLKNSSNKLLQNLATEFYMGVELAIDSLQKLGFDATVNVIDIPSDSIGIYKLLSTPAIANADLVFGPLVPASADVVGRWCSKKGIPMVCPSQCNVSLLKNNPLIYASVSSDITQQKVLARYVLENFKTSQIILVNPGTTKDAELYNAFRNHFMALSKKGANIKLIEAKTTDFTTFLRKNGDNVLVFPTRDKGAALKFIDNLHKSVGKSNAMNVTVMGTKEWGSFDDINGYYKNKFNITWASSSDLNYTLPAVKTLGYLYRAKYNADLTKAGAHGFDVFYYFCRTLLMQENVPSEVINSFDLKAVETGSGKENSSCFILKHEDYQINRVGVFYE